MKAIYTLGAISWSIAAVQFSGELGLAELAMTIAQGPLAMGFVVAALQWVAGKKLSDPFTRTVLCVSLVLLIVWVGLWVPVGFGFGSDKSPMAERMAVIAMLLLGVVAGVGYSAFTGFPRSPAPSATQRSLPGLFWFTLGLL